MTEEERKLAVRRNRVIMLIMLAFVALIGLRIMNIQTQSPEYDEIWTVQHYVNIPAGRILSDVATPNNHVLNSLGIKFFSSFIPNTVLAMRLPALLAFAGLFFLLLRAALKLYANPAARGALLGAVLLDGMILHYAETARGYSLQVFFVFGLLVSLLSYPQGEGKKRIFPAVMWLVCAVCSCLSVSSGVIYVAVITGLWGVLNVPFRSKPAVIWRTFRPLFLSGLIWTVFVLVWYGGNYSRFAEGRANFGESFTSIGQFLLYCGNVLWSTGLLWPVLVLLAGLIFFRRMASSRTFLLCLGSVLMVLISAMFTKGGPPRVYLPLVPVAMFGAAAVLDQLLTSYEKLRKVSLVFCLAAVAVSAWYSEPRRIGSADPDIGTVFAEVRKIDPAVFVAWRPTDSYTVLNLFGREALEDNMNRMRDPIRLFLLHDNCIGTMRFSDFGTGAVDPGCASRDSGFADAVKKMPYWLYSLRPLTAGEDLNGKAVLCFVHGPIPELHPRNSSNWLKDHFAAVNGMYTRGSSSFCFAASGSKLNADQLIQIERSRQGRVFFRAVAH